MRQVNDVIDFDEYSKSYLWRFEITEQSYKYNDSIIIGSIIEQTFSIRRYRASLLFTNRR